MLITRSGTAYRILNRIATPSIWLPLSRLTICKQVLNLNGEWTTYYEIRNKDDNEMLEAIRER